MKTLTFKEPELQELSENNDAKELWHQFVKKLGMTGQTEDLLHEDGTPIPYQRLNTRWVKILKVVCPSTSDYQKYSHSTIPLDVLFEIDKALDANCFQRIQIWYNEVENDPFVVGISGKTFQPKHYLIAQWGEELLPFEVIEQKAKKSMIEHVYSYLLSINKTDSIERLVESYLDKDVNPTIIDPTTAHGRIYVF